MFTDKRIDIIQYEQTLVDMFVELYSKQNIRLGEDWDRAIIQSSNCAITF